MRGRHARSRCRSQPRRPVLPGGDVARLPRGPLSPLRAFPRRRPFAAGCRHDLVRDGPCRRCRAAATPSPVDRRIALHGREGEGRAEGQVAEPAVHGSARPHPPARPGCPRLHPAPHRGAAPGDRDHCHRAGLRHEGAGPRGRPDRGLRLPAAGAGDLRPAGRAGGRRGDVHRLVACDCSRPRSLRAALAGARRRDRQLPPGAARLSRRPAGSAPQAAGQRPALGTGGGRCRRRPHQLGRGAGARRSCCWSPATRPR